MSPEEIIARLTAAEGESDLPRLYRELFLVPDEVLFSTLFPLAVRNQNGDVPVAFAACVLYGLNPSCPLNALDATAALLSDWDVSIEEVPWYLARQFGVEAVRSAVAELSAQPSLAPENHSQLKSINYWLDNFRPR